MSATDEQPSAKIPKIDAAIGAAQQVMNALIDLKQTVIGQRYDSIWNTTETAKLQAILSAHQVYNTHPDDADYDEVTYLHTTVEGNLSPETQANIGSVMHKGNRVWRAKPDEYSLFLDGHVDFSEAEKETLEKLQIVFTHKCLRPLNDWV
jgi:hypothetical protein